MKKPLGECVVEHVIPQQVIVNRLMDMNPPTKSAVSKLLKRWYHVRLVTREEHERLTKLKLRYTMPSEWDGKEVFARYDAAGIRCSNRK
jgi:hypothetical protein